jgi:hypothetical protein
MTGAEAMRAEFTPSDSPAAFIDARDAYIVMTSCLQLRYLSHSPANACACADAIYAETPLATPLYGFATARATSVTDGAGVDARSWSLTRGRHAQPAAPPL